MFLRLAPAKRYRAQLKSWCPRFELELAAGTPGAPWAVMPRAQVAIADVIGVRAATSSARPSPACWRATGQTSSRQRSRPPSGPKPCRIGPTRARRHLFGVRRPRPRGSATSSWGEGSTRSEILVEATPPGRVGRSGVARALWPGVVRRPRATCTTSTDTTSRHQRSGQAAPHREIGRYPEWETTVAAASRTKLGPCRREPTRGLGATGQRHYPPRNRRG